MIQADQSIPNDDGLLPNDIALKLYGKSLFQLRQDSPHELIAHMHPRDYSLLPDILIYRNLPSQSIHLMEQGRCEYSQPPHSHKAILKNLNSKQNQSSFSTGPGSHGHIHHSNSIDDLSDSIDTSSYAKRGYLSEVMQQHNSSMSLLSSAENLTQDHRSLLGNQQFSTFCYNTIDDVVDLLRRQAHLLSRFDAEERLKTSGLSLLAGENNDPVTGAGAGASVGAGGGQSSIGEGRSHMSQDNSRRSFGLSNEREKILIEAQKSLSSYSMLGKILTSEKKRGGQPLPLTKRSGVGLGVGAKGDPRSLHGGPSLTMDNLHAAVDVSTKHQIKKQNSKSENESSHQGGGGGGGRYLSCIDMPYRHITTLSTRTNLIHMNIGDQGITKICQALPGNSFIQSIILSTARITSLGFQSLIDILCFLPNLTYLDLSQNAIHDEGAHSLAVTLSNSMIMQEKISLERITLMGNRITSDGAKPLINAVLMSNIHYLK
jgi:hypothetical protein